MHVLVTFKTRTVQAVHRLAVILLRHNPNFENCVPTKTGKNLLISVTLVFNTLTEFHQTQAALLELCSSYKKTKAYIDILTPDTEHAPTPDED